MVRFGRILFVVVVMSVVGCSGAGGDKTSEPTAVPPQADAPVLFNTIWDLELDKQGDNRGADSDLASPGKFESAGEIALRLGFSDDQQVGAEEWQNWWLGYVYDGELVVPSRAPGMGPGIFQIQDHLLILREQPRGRGTQIGRTETYLWHIEGDQLTLTLVQNPPEFAQNTPEDLASGIGYFGGTYTRSSETDPSS